MLSDEEKREYEELKSLLYTGTISQYGKRKLIDIIEKKSKEIEEAEQKERKAYIDGVNELKQELEKEKEKNKELEDTLKCTQNSWYEDTNVAYELCNNYWEDKIKAKIEEYKKQQKEEPDAYLCIKVLQSLLEKE